MSESNRPPLLLDDPMIDGAVKYAKDAKNRGWLGE